jgi:hypothetical protein
MEGPALLLALMGDPATSEAEVAMVRIELEVGVNGRTQTLSTQVALRNRMQ